ncbi:DNA repair protein RecO [Aeromicrobium sp. 636]|uniref:DNA repair protein RecO n=1 Tax=Aeromicrobium senzhongii TaxID=2663859 RepID=A0A8I0JZ60_9ACTN|nr:MULTISPECIES: DNA repair protein RecO [Aeromicrobium]MBC9225622.1 DNA repair protein RecO [Aeromicrobium senzhongii]MCQ3997731.1 DNA repair protein RecO [Aeromicrobium sp. 636]MTB87658.1 DNA repair protein RecO [Aeromicrobium senzhongii]QNL95308.1 DNA repair protein RecO [Aeromicrobium senzhongii]
MGTYRDTGVVLRTQKLGEADRIVTMLTRGRGVVRAVGRGVRKTSSRFGGRLEPFMHVDVQFVEGRTLDIVAQVVTIDPFASHLGEDYGAYTAGTAMLETAERLVSDTAEPSVPQYQLLVGALRALTEHRQPPGVLLDSFQLRSLAIAGYAPSFDGCARCGLEGPHRHFHAGSGGMLCDACRVPGSSVPAATTVALLAALLVGDWNSVALADDRTRREAGSIVANYLSWHLERGLRSLAHVDR